jgi:hypothetical protein
MNGHVPERCDLSSPVPGRQLTGPGIPFGPSAPIEGAIMPEALLQAPPRRPSPGSVGVHSGSPPMSGQHTSVAAAATVASLGTVTTFEYRNYRFPISLFPVPLV